MKEINYKKRILINKYIDVDNRIFDMTKGREIMKY